MHKSLSIRLLNIKTNDYKRIISFNAIHSINKYIILLIEDFLSTHTRAQTVLINKLYKVINLKCCEYNIEISKQKY